MLLLQEDDAEHGIELFGPSPIMLAVTVRSWIEKDKTVVTVTDNSGGIDEGIIDKIYDAYFTTKELGKGTGVGLFVAKRIIETNMGGRLSMRNVEGGAEFRIEV